VARSASHYLDYMVGSGGLDESDVPIKQGWHHSGRQWLVPFGEIRGSKLIETSSNGRFVVLMSGGDGPRSIRLKDRSTGAEHVIFGEEYTHSLMFRTQAHFLADGLLVHRWMGESLYNLFDANPPHDDVGSFKAFPDEEHRRATAMNYSNGLLVGLFGGTVPFTIDPVACARAQAVVRLPSE
jgi:hypothetical protein